MRNIRVTIAYDGTEFLGWQKTKEGPSVEEALSFALEKVLQEPLSLQAASRTDAGVHADGQVVNFFLESTLLSLGRLQYSANALLPSSIRILAIEEAPIDFHPSLDAQGKEYQYFIANTRYEKPKNRFYSWHVAKPLDLPLMQEISQALLGTHDFSAFSTEYTANPKDPICTLTEINVTQERELVRISIKGDRFLFRMMRGLVGTLVYIGCGRLPESSLQEILESGQRAKAGVTAPAHGLHLTEVFYKKNIHGILPSQNQERALC